MIGSRHSCIGSRSELSGSWATIPLRSQPQKPEPKTVLIVAMDPVRPLELFGLLEVFHEANRISGSEQIYDVRLVSACSSRRLDTSTGMFLEADLTYQDWRDRADTVLLSGSEWPHPCVQDDGFVSWLREQGRKSRRMGSVHTGTLVFARVGLLNGRRATTHWQWCDELQGKNPGVSVERDVIYVRHGNFYSSAGATAGIDLALALVEEDLGTTVACKIAQMFLLFSRRSGGQPQVSATLAAQFNEMRPMGELLSWLPDNLQQALPVAKLARKAAMSPRNFARSFRAQLGTTPAKHIERLRLESAQRQLETTTRNLDGVAAACGFANCETLRRVFLRHIGMTPGQYRASRRSQTGGNAGVAPEDRLRDVRASA